MSRVPAILVCRHRMMNIAKTEGMGGLYAGVTPAVARHVPYTGFRAIGALAALRAPSVCAARVRLPKVHLDD